MRKSPNRFIRIIHRQCHSVSFKIINFENLWLADGSTFPFLPAKNLTFTLMANASRIAATDF